MSDIAGPPAPKEIQSPIRGADKTAHVAKDPNSSNTRTGDQPKEQAARDQGEALHSRDPAVSIASSAAHLVSGQEISQPITRIDAEGRPIIVTDTVTLALKPDAGLQPNDTVHLIVVDAGKQVTADLHRQNSQPIDPPVRLSVTVIEVHTVATTNNTSAANTEQKSKAGLDRPYSATVTAKDIAANQPTTNLTAVISRPDAILPSQVDPPTAINAPPAHPDKSIPAAPIPGSTTIASSADLATLIQQQTAQEITPQTHTPAASQSLPKSASGPGIGPAINAVSATGAPAVLQILDLSVSKVLPAEVTTVKTVQTVTAAEARALPVGAAAFGTNAVSGELAKVTTTQGEFILPATDAAALTGETVRVSAHLNPPVQPSANSGHTNDIRLGALFIENKAGALPTKVDVILLGKPAAEEVVDANLAVVKSVQTVAAFLGAEGPKTDLRLQTSHGDISLTVPSGVRPQPGDILRVISSTDQLQSIPDAAPQQDAAAKIPEITPTSIAHAVSASSAAETPNILANWPAMEESLAALMGTNAAAAGSLASKTAQGGAKLANSLLFFLKAAGMAGNSNWIGTNVEAALARSSQLALSSLRSDIAQMATLAGETVGEWRPILLPFDARGGEVPLAALLLGQKPDVDPDDQHNNQDPDQNGKPDNQRFILQIQFSVLGDIQLDGNIRKQVFDLTVRSRTALSATLQQDASDLFYRALTANGYSGTIDFNQQDTFSVDAAALIEDHLRGEPVK